MSRSYFPNTIGVRPLRRTPITPDFPDDLGVKVSSDAGLFPDRALDKASQLTVVVVCENVCIIPIRQASFFIVDLPRFSLSHSLALDVNPFSHDSGKPVEHFRSKQHFIDVAHVKHINDPAQIRLALDPPSVMCINHQEMS